MRKITVIFDGELSSDDYADRGNGTPVVDLNARWASLGTQCPWR